MAEEKPNPLTTRDFSKVYLTLDNVLIPQDKLSPTPSMLDGIDLDNETDLRVLGCELIQSSGILLKLPQVAMATGQVLFQRFFYSKSFVKHTMEVVAMACINLASKIEEAPRRIRDVINVFHHIKQVRNKKTIHPLILDQNYINLKNQVIKAERRILKELGFCVHVKHPHKIIVMFLQVLECERNPKLVQCAWNYMNDSFRTNVFVVYNPETIACACIYLAARQLQICLPDNPAWYLIFNVEEYEIQDICLTLLRLYARPKPNYEALEKVVNDAKKIQIEAKLKAKGVLSEYGTPSSTPRSNSPKNVSPNPALMGKVKKIKSENDSGAHIEHSNNNRNYHRKKRSHSLSDRSISPHSRSRSRSSRSRSRSRTPVGKRKYRSPYRKMKKENRHSSPIYNMKDKRKRKRKSFSRSRSPSPSPNHYKVKMKKHYKMKDYHAYNKSPDRRQHSRKHRNGHRSPNADRFKYRR